MHGIETREKWGDYSVNSAYGLIRDQKEVQHSSDNSGFWHKIWNLKIPVMIKHFMCRASYDILPRKDELILKKIEVNSLCQVRNLSQEIAFHLLIECVFTQSCWDKAGYTSMRRDFSTFAKWMNEAIQMHTTNEIQKMAW